MLTFFDRITSNIRNPRNRLLTSVELANRLDRQHSSNQAPQHIVSVISINSTYIEVADYMFKTRGVMAVVGVFGALLFTILNLAFTVSDISKWNRNMSIAPVEFPVLFSATVIILT